MVVALGPGKFYGSSLPRPRFYTDVQFNDERVDPPPPVNDALMSWAHDAHWSMGGLSTTRFRLQGRIEGNVDRLRAQLEKQVKEKSPEKVKPTKSGKSKRGERIDVTPSPPPAPLAIKRRRVVVRVDPEEDEEEGEVLVREKRRLVRKLGDDFERVAKENGMTVEKDPEVIDVEAVGKRTRSKRSEVVDLGEISKKKKKLVKGGKRVVAAAAESRSSPRLAKSGNRK